MNLAKEKEDLELTEEEKENLRRWAEEGSLSLEDDELRKALKIAEGAEKTRTEEANKKALIEEETIKLREPEKNDNK